MHSQPLARSRFCAIGREGELPAVVIDHPRFSATVLLQGAQLVRFCPRGEPNWLWLSEREPFIVGKAVRGGIPICWPWFGDPARNPEAVRRLIHSRDAHGFARLAAWALDALEESEQAVTLTLALDTATVASLGWLGHARVSARFRFTQHTLQVHLETRNSADAPLHLSQALHSYFPTSDILKTTISGLDGQFYVDALDDWRPKVQRGPVEFRAETDRIYTVAAPLELTTPEWTMRMSQQGSTSAVIWNPWDEKARRLSHFEPGAWQRMFCVETANALTDAVRLEPGGVHLMGFEVSRL